MILCFLVACHTMCVGEVRTLCVSHAPTVFSCYTCTTLSSEQVTFSYYFIAVSSTSLTICPTCVLGQKVVMACLNSSS